MITNFKIFENKEYTNKFNFEPGKIYEYEDLPKQIKKDIEVQFEDNYEYSPEDYTYKAILINPDELYDYLITHFGKYYIDEYMEEPYIKKIVNDIKKNGINYPSVGVEGNHRALVCYMLKIPLPYLEMKLKPELDLYSELSNENYNISKNKEPEKILTYYSNNKVKSIVYKLNGQKHREDGPASQSWFENGLKEEEAYYIDGYHHKEHEPAYNTWYDNGKKSQEVYYIKNKYHREDGPAYQKWDENGQITKYYYLNGIFYDRENWLEKLKEFNSPHYKEQKDLYDMEQNIEKYNL